jgi:hypothetical protein
VSPIPYKTEAPPLPSPKKRRASGKPRKRLTQTRAERGTEPAVIYKWQEVLDSFVFNPDEKVNVILAEDAGKWTMTAELMGKRYVGDRPTLEEAFKATANLIYKHTKEYWLRMDARPVTAPWAHTLPEVP